MRKRVGVLLLILLFMVAVVPNVASAVALDPRTLATVNKPGVVLVQTTWTADVTWYEFTFDSSMEEDLVTEVQRMIEDGEIGTSDQEIYQAMVSLMINYIEYYAFSTGNEETERMSTAAVGTGFIVTPDGYIVTNAHVVNTDEEELYLSFAMSSLEQYAIEAADSFMEEMRRSGYQMTQDEWDGIASAWYRLLSQSMEISNLQTTYQCFIGNVSPGSDVSAKGQQLDLRKMGEPIPGKDVAILKLDGRNLPTVALGDDTKLKTGDRVYAMGYPAVATLSEALNVAQAIQEPTLTQGIISARKEMSGSWSVLQTDAAIHNGNSGGPLFNEAGEVIGINTFGMLDQESGAQVAGMNFAIPISIVKQFLNELNVTPSESGFTADFKRALDAYNSADYTTSLELLRGINETNPGFPVVQELLAEAREASDANPQPTQTPDAQGQAAQTENDGSSGMPPVVLWGIIGGLVLVILIMGVVLLAKRKGAKAARSQRPVSMDQQYSAPLQASTTAKAPVHSQSSAPEAAGFCAQCGSAIHSGSKFCNECGAPIEQQKSGKCPACGHENKPDTKFCSECGTKLA